MPALFSETPTEYLCAVSPSTRWHVGSLAIARAFAVPKVCMTITHCAVCVVLPGS